MNGKTETISIDGPESIEIDAEGKLTLLPALIDPQVDFCVPGFEQLEDWKSGAAAAIAGGVTTVFDSPYNLPPCDHLDALKSKKQRIDQQLEEAQIPLHAHLYFLPNKQYVDEISQTRGKAIAIRVNFQQLDNLHTEHQTFLERIFQIAAQNNVMVVSDTDSKRSILLAERYGAQVYLLNVSDRADLDMIHQAKEKQLLVYAATTPRHLFGSNEDPEHLWKAIHNGIIDSIGSNHSPCNDSDLGGPEIETMLPLLLNAINEGKLTLEKVVQLTRISLEYIYGLERNKDLVLVDMNCVKTVEGKALKTKSKRSHYEGRSLKGWPVYTILNGKVHKI